MRKTRSRLQDKIAERIIARTNKTNLLDAKACQMFDARDYQSAIKIYEDNLVELNKIDQDTTGRTLKIQFNLSSTIVNTHYMLGKCYTNIKQFPLATIHFDKCTNLDPKYRKFDIAFYRGGIFYQLGAFKEAEQLYRLAITNPAPNLQEESYKDIYYNLAAGLVEGTFTKTSEEQDPAVILSYFDKAMDCCPKESNLARGLFLKKLGRTAEAINYLLEAAKLNSPQAHTELAEIYRNLGNYDLFTQHLQLAANLGESTAVFNLAYAYDSGQFEEYIPWDPTLALAWYEKAAEKDLPEALHNLGYKYVYGEDVAVNLEKGISLLQKADELGYKLATAELGICFDKGLGNNNQPNRNAARKKFQQAYLSGILSAGYNLAHSYYQESIEQTDLVAKKTAMEKAVLLWAELSVKDHPASAFNLGIIYATASSGVNRDFGKAAQLFNKAGELKVEHAYTNLALLIIEEYIATKDKTYSNDLLERFNIAIQHGIKNDESYAKFISNLYEECIANAGIKNYQIFWQIVKQYRRTDCIQNNLDICTIARDSSLSPLKRIEQILNLDIERSNLVVSIALLPNGGDDDCINLATKIFNIGKLFNQSDCNVAFLQAKINKILELIKLIKTKIEHFSLRDLTDILYGITNLPLNYSVQPIILEALIAISNRLNKIVLELTNNDNTMENIFNIHRLMSIFHAFAKAGTFPLEVKELQISKKLLQTIVDNLPDAVVPAIISGLLYDIALLENHWQMANSCWFNSKDPFFSKDLLNAVLQKIPSCSEIKSNTELTQLHMALNIIVNNERINLEKLSLNSELKSRIDKYCGIETINLITNGDITVTSSAIQHQVIKTLRNILPATAILKKEYFIGIFPVDLFVSIAEHNIIIQVDGPRHFLFDQNREKILSVPELLRREALNCTIMLLKCNSQVLHIPFDEWDMATSTSNREEYLKKKLAGLDCRFSLEMNNTLFFSKIDKKSSPQLPQNVNNNTRARPILYEQLKTSHHYLQT